MYILRHIYICIYISAARNLAIFTPVTYSLFPYRHMYIRMCIYIYTYQRMYLCINVCLNIYVKNIYIM